MYYTYFGLNQPPFRITPDTNLFFPGGNRGAILDSLVYAILNGEGIVKVVGEVGSGKTMLCRMLEKELPDRVEIVYLANPSLSPENILYAIAFELKLPIEAATPRVQVMNELQQYLARRHGENRQVVVFVEEAQSMPIATLEQIRLLSNLETQQNKLLQIVLFGQPELDEMISQPHIRQLKERITYSFQLQPFKTGDIRDYLNTRLRACGFRAGDLFTPGALGEIERFSTGLVRRINILADKSLLAAYAGNDREIGAAHVRKAARDSEFVSGWSRHGRRALAALAATVALIALLTAGWELGRKTDVGGSLPATRNTPAASITPADAGVETQAAPGAGQQAAPPAEQPMSTAAAPPVQVPVQSPIAEDAEPAPAAAVQTPGAEVPSAAAEDVPLGAAATDTEAKDHALLGIGAVLDLQDQGTARLEPTQAQARVAPSSNASSRKKLSVAGDVCRLCWSIIYKPLIDTENL